MSAPALEELVARVRARLARTRAHLAGVLAGRETDLLYSWGVYPEDGPNVPQVIPGALVRDWPEASFGLNWSPLRMPASRAPRRGAHFHTASPQGIAYLAAMSEWPLPTMEARRAAYRQAFAATYPTAPSEPIVDTTAWRAAFCTADDPARFAAALDHHLRESGALEPEALPLRMTIAEGLARLDADIEHLAASTGADIRQRLALVPGKLRAAVGAREELVTRWPWPRDDHAAGRVLAILIALADPPPTGELAPGVWPPEVAPLDVATWAERVLVKEYPREIAALLEAARGGDWRTLGRYVWTTLAVLYATLQAVERDRDRRAMAIDAGRPHHELLMAWRDLPKDTRKPHHVSSNNTEIQLLAPGRSVQLTLAFDPESGTMSEALITALRTTRGWKGLRHWAAMQRLLSVEGGRAGWVRWTLDGHLVALGTSVKHRTRAALRADVARQVEAFTHLELAVYAADGTLRERRPLLLVGAKYDRLQGSEWKLDGMQLTINPLLYSGVREAGGKLGRNWHPAAVELAQVDDVRHPHTLALGLILPIRWRLALEEDKDHLTIKGANALAMAGITYRSRKPGAAWKALERDLAELHRIGGLGRWEWDAADTPRTLEGRLHLWPAPWMLDRTLREVRPRELPPGPAVLTGAELKAWRTRHSLTQAKAAEKLHVSRPTIARAEAHPLDPLTQALTEKLRTSGA